MKYKTPDAQVKKTYIGIVLDESGSMSSCKNEAISSVNEQIQSIRANAKGYEENTFITFVTFNKEVDIVLKNRSIADLKEIDSEIYKPDGMTALYDAIGDTITILRDSANAKDDNAFLLIIISDGMNNIRRNYGLKEIKERIKDLQMSGRWTFTYMGQITDITQAEEMGIPKGNVATFINTAEGMRDASTVMHMSAGNYMKSRIEDGAVASASFYEPN